MKRVGEEEEEYEWRKLGLRKKMGEQDEEIKRNEKNTCND